MPISFVKLKEKPLPAWIHRYMTVLAMWRATGAAYIFWNVKRLCIVSEFGDVNISQLTAPPEHKQRRGF